MRSWILVLVIAMFAPAAMGQSYLSVEGYGVEVQVDTMNGYFGVGTSAGERLTYDFNDPESRASSNFVLKIDGQTYGFPSITPSVSFDIRDYPSDGCPRLLKTTNTIQNRWEIDSPSHNVVLSQYFTPDSLDISLGVIKVRYLIANYGTTDVHVALEHKWDILVGSSEGSTISITGSFSDTSCVYTTSMPGWFIAPEIALTDTIDQLVAMGVVNSMGATRPDLLAFGDEIVIIPSVFSVDTSFTGDNYSVSEVLLRWDTVTLIPGASWEIVTYYGLGEMHDFLPEIALSYIFTDWTISDDTLENPNVLSLAVSNNTGSILTLDTVWICISYDDDLAEFIDSIPAYESDTCIEIYNLQNGETEVRGWAFWADGDTCGEFEVTIICSTNVAVLDSVVATVTARIPCIDGIDEENRLPENFALSAYPNPFNSAVTIALDGVGAGLAPARVEIYDVNGRRINVISSEGFIPDEKSPANPQEISPYGRNDSGQSCQNDNRSVFVWTSAPSLGSGVYLVRAKIGEKYESKRIVYLK